MSQTREELVKELKKEVAYTDEKSEGLTDIYLVADFIIADRKRVVYPIENFKKSQIHLFGVMGWDGKDLPYKVIDETLKNAGVDL